MLRVKVDAFYDNSSTTANTTYPHNTHSSISTSTTNISQPLDSIYKSPSKDKVRIRYKPLWSRYKISNTNDTSPQPLDSILKEDMGTAYKPLWPRISSAFRITSINNSTARQTPRATPRPSYYPLLAPNDPISHYSVSSGVTTTTTTTTTPPSTPGDGSTSSHHHHHHQTSSDFLFIAVCSSPTQSPWVVEVDDETPWEEVGRRVAWKGGRGCQSYLLLLLPPHTHQHPPKPPNLLLSLTNSPTSPWDPKGRYLLVGLVKGQLEELTRTFKGRKTQHLVGLVKSESDGEWEVYMNQLYWGPGVSRVATWRKGRFTSSRTFFPEKTANLQGATLNVVTFEYRPSTIYYRTANNSVAFHYGRDVEMVKAVAPVLNFTANFIEPPNGEKWGTLRDDGTWSGVVGSLARGEADLAIANLFVSSMLGRDLYQGYSTLYDSEEVKFLIRTEPPLPRWQSLWLPFNRDTWLAMLLGLLILAPVTYLIVRAANDGTGGNGQQELGEPGTLRSMLGVYMFTISLHLQEPHPAAPHTHTSRLLVAFLLLYTLVLTRSYSCNLTAFLTIARQPKGIETLLELHEANVLLYENSYFIRDQLKTSPTQYLRDLADRHTLVKNIGEASPGVKKGLGVFITNIGNMNFFFNTIVAPSSGGYGARMIKESLVSYSLAMGTPSQSPLKDHLDQAISKAYEAGLSKYWKQRSYVLYRKNKRELGVGDDAALVDALIGDATASTQLAVLSLDHLQSAFYILGFFYLFAALMFAAEVVLHRCGFLHG
ncbi:hypothetical protein Pmani_029943 [Petrolisthes manimaculis]|uniref:Ionotropic glutamate receptor L-glutamate and glycine-binding domain-containing protein n=1 Tax=Petrolisthes manimaculis TaxID=1843537 RepID=A0AAE1NZ59_9EUCA|nr:hypothetical protein Pmani_029943 [Petrolisthes manimaculis]